MENDGVLVSWALPRGIPAHPDENRLAVHTEDHPLEYLEFEGDIPKGEYGAGKMRIWDRGTYDVLKWEPRKVEVAFHGERLQGRYALFPLDKGESPKDWMIHRMDPVVLNGTEGAAVQLAQCCLPIPGDSMFGHFRRDLAKHAVCEPRLHAVPRCRRTEGHRRRKHRHAAQLAGRGVDDEHDHVGLAVPIELFRLRGSRRHCRR